MMNADQQEPVNAPSSEEPTVIFDPARLAAQLSELLELYLARAKEALLEEQMSSREAVACAKQVAGMLDDTQSGKLARVDTTTEWPTLVVQPFRAGSSDCQTRAKALDYHPHPRTRGFSPASSSVQQPALARHSLGDGGAGNQQPLRSLADAVTAVCQWDEETAILEPWAQLLVRMNQLTQRLSADIEEWKSSCEEKPTPTGVGRADQPGSSAPAAENGGAGDGGAGEGATGVGGTGDGGAGVPPAIGGHPEPSAPDGGAQVPALQKNPSVQPPTTNTCPPKCREAVRRRNQKPPHAIQQNPRGP